jgi:riboflavin kinase/FMN adenylyltransferase
VIDGTRPAVTGDLNDLGEVPRVVTIGTFDGVHRGHQRLLTSAVARGRDTGCAVLVVTFEPIPAMVLRRDRFLGRICSVAEKVERITRTGVDEIVTLVFDWTLAGQSPEEFMTVLWQTTRLRELWVGEAFALGKNRVGDVTRLAEIGARLGFEVVAVPRLVDGGHVVSSSSIRDAIITGDVTTAARLLGTPFRVSGEVIHGAHFGRTIGYPTANVVPPPALVPLADGIYAALASLTDGAGLRPAMTYVGTRPTVNSGDRLIETHLLDFDGDLYGQVLQVDVLHRLRPDATFADIDGLVAQLRRDEAETRAFFSTDAAWAVEALLSNHEPSPKVETH